MRDLVEKFSVMCDWNPLFVTLQVRSLSGSHSDAVRIPAGSQRIAKSFRTGYLFRDPKSTSLWTVSFNTDRLPSTTLVVSGGRLFAVYSRNYKINAHIWKNTRNPD